jgi:hypothetical protein
MCPVISLYKTDSGALKFQPWSSVSMPNKAIFFMQRLV